MPRKSYDRMYEEKIEETKEETAPVEEPVAKPAKAKKIKVEEPKVAEEIPATKPFMGEVTGGLNLNVRKTPNGTIIGSLSSGAMVRVLDDSNDEWYKIESPVGYVMKKYIKKA